MKHYFDGILMGIYKPSKKFFIKSPYLSNSTDPLRDPLREWASLIWGFAMPILDKQAEVMIQKLL
jgi:hypothetical protein